MKSVFLSILLVFITPVLAATKILMFAGSTRDHSYNKCLIAEAAAICKELGGDVTVIDLKDYPLPFYNADLEAQEGIPDNAKKLKALFIENHAIVISSPQYNASIPALLKNVLDWVSRGDKKAYQGKKFVIMNASPGKKGGARALVHLRAILEDCGGEVLQNELVVSFAAKNFNTNGSLVNIDLKHDLEQIIRKISCMNFENTLHQLDR